MRFVHYYPRALTDSGVTVALWAWADALADAGHEVEVVHGPVVASGDVAGVFAERGGASVRVVQLRHVGSGRLTTLPVNLGRRLIGADVLVLHEGWVPSNMAAARAAQRAHVPYLVMPHGVYEPRWRHYLRGPRRFREALERRVLNSALAVHTFFESENRPIARLAPAARFITVPTGFDVGAAEWRGGGGYLAWIGRYDPVNKGLDSMVEAVALIPESERPIVRLRGYDYRGGIATLRRLVQNARLEPWIEIGGVIGGEMKRQFLIESDGALLPSRWESHSVSLLESLSLGVPTIVSDSIHISSLLREREAAVLSAPDGASIAHAMSELRRTGVEIGRRGRDLVKSAFSWSAVVSRYEHELQSALSERG